jgi:hypothetical protein
MRKLLALVSVFGLLVFAMGGSVQARDGNDRTQSMDISRDRSESRIERLREDRNIDKVRAEKPAKPKKEKPKTQQ